MLLAKHLPILFLFLVTSFLSPEPHGEALTHLTETHTAYDFIYVKMSRKGKSSETESRLVGARSQQQQLGWTVNGHVRSCWDNDTMSQP